MMGEGTLNDIPRSPVEAALSVSESKYISGLEKQKEGKDTKPQLGHEAGRQISRSRTLEPFTFLNLKKQKQKKQKTLKRSIS